jgi:hypothetical protein
MSTVEPTALAGSWVHSHEEDGDAGRVFRPASYSFPPSRGRSRLELRPDGSYTEETPGPTDRPEAASGRWSLEGGALQLEPESGTPRVLRVVSAEPDRLVLAG